jgi:hypothetical protein
MEGRSEWFGDRQDGIEYRWDGDNLDEIVVYVAGKVVLHVEQMSDTCYWMGIYVKDYEGAANFGSSNKRSHVKFYAAEGFKNLAAAGGREL